jgi:hypothetical protein
MLTDTAARTEPVRGATDERAYQAFCEAISSSARGRAFLAEYSRRNRNADTEQLLAGIERLQALMTVPAQPQAMDAIKQDLRALLDEIVTAQCELEAHILAMKAAKLAELMALVGRRISNMLEASQVDLTPATPSVDATPAAEADPPLPVSSPEMVGQAERPHLSVVPLPDQPELPIPSPASTQPPSISLVHSELTITEAALAEPSPAPQPAPEATNLRLPEPRLLPVEVRPVAKPTPQDPLASIKALSEEERLALFT